jgi:thiamine biosynthesis lipoprotein
MGTLVTVTVVHPEVAAARKMVADAFNEMARLEDILSRHRPGTPVARLNAEGAVRGAPPELIEVMRRATEYSTLTGGAFDVTIAPLLRLYSSRFERGKGPPGDPEIRSALALVGYERVHIDDRSIALDKPGMSVTLDGIAKGYVVDRTVGVLVDAGAERVMVDAGGDMASGGREARDDPWTVGIQDPYDADGYLGLVRLRGECIATSGDYVQTFTEDRRFHHIIDPRTGRSPDHNSSVTVVAGTALDADALSTAVMVLGPTDGLQLLERLDGAEGVIVTKRHDELRTTGLARYTA